MPELRWILLILGVLFIATLAWWELRRQRRSPQAQEDRTRHRFREPSLGLPELRPREPAPELPVVELEDDSMIGLRVDGVRIEEDTVELPALSETEILEEPEDTPAAQPSAVQLPGPERLSEPVLDWPPEDQRKVITLRVVADAEERFSGRALRLALAAQGFTIGKFSIFHKPGPDGRVVVSAASITQPGTFDMQTMDIQRYGGVGLFAVLPGPLPASQMFNELLAAARNLSDRLQGSLQNERGEALTPSRVAMLREMFVPESEL
jgi:cell division protein ZipA